MTRADLISAIAQSFELLDDPIISITIDDNEETIRVKTYAFEYEAEICSDGDLELVFIKLDHFDHHVVKLGEPT